MKKLLSVLLLMSIVMTFGVLATSGNFTAVTISAPTTTQNSIGGTYTFTGTYTGNSSYNISVYYNNSGSFASSGNIVFVCADTSVRERDSTWTCDGTISNFPGDCTGHVLNVTAYSSGAASAAEGSGNVSATISTVIWDTTAPTISTFDGLYEGGLQALHKPHSYTVTSTDNCDSSTNTTVGLRRQDASRSTNKTTRVDIWGFEDINLLGSYTAFASVTDNAGNRAHTSFTFDVKGSSKDASILAITKETEKTTKAGISGFFLILLISIVASIIVIVLLYFQFKK